MHKDIIALMVNAEDQAPPAYVVVVARAAASTTGQVAEVVSLVKMVAPKLILKK